MTAEAPVAEVAIDRLDLAAEIVGARMAMRLTLTAILMAMAKARALNLADVFDLIRPMIDEATRTVVEPSSPLEAKALALAIEDLGDLEPTVIALMAAQRAVGTA